MTEDTKRAWSASVIDSFAETVREHVRSQRGVWRKIPYLALLSANHIGQSKFLVEMYTEGYFRVNDSNVAVDLLNGELVDVRTVLKRYNFSENHQPQLATSEDIARAFVLFQESFSAFNTVKDLRKIISQFGGVAETKKKIKKDRKEQLANLEALMRKERTYLSDNERE